VARIKRVVGEVTYLKEPIVGGQYRYKCMNCGYSAVVGGGPDIGFTVKTQTGYCSTCQKLVDYVTEVWSPDGETEKRVIIGACPFCRNNVQHDWNDGDPCPRCGGEFGERDFECQWI
jgi:hypothetical protein